MIYELHYWPGVQGRGEFVRLALEQAGARYVDVGREPEDQGGGIPALLERMADDRLDRPTFAAPYLKDGELMIGQTANILLHLGPKLDLTLADEPGRLWVNQMQLTVADLADEAHGVHHPLDSALYYEDQKEAAARKAEGFRKARIPKYLGWFERILGRQAKGAWLTGGKLTYADLSLFEAVEALLYAFPKAMARIAPDAPRVLALSERVKALPNVAAYLASPRRMPFGRHDLFRHYPELDDEG